MSRCLLAERAVLAAAVAAMILAVPARGGYKSMAKELARAASRAGIARVGVLPFQSNGAGTGARGWTMAERLTTQLVRTGTLQAVERTFLEKILDEHRLARTGALAPQTIKKLGAISSVDGLVIGSFSVEGQRVLIQARLIEVETGLIVAAVESGEEPETSELPVPVWPDFAAAPAPGLTVEPPSDLLGQPPGDLLAVMSGVGAEGSAGLRDALSDECSDAALRADQYETGVLELKARYWALRLKKGVVNTSLTANPGSEISDPGLRRRFYESLAIWYRSHDIPELSLTERAEFLVSDHKADLLRRRCGL